MLNFFSAMLSVYARFFCFVISIFRWLSEVETIASFVNLFQNLKIFSHFEKSFV